MDEKTQRKKELYEKNRYFSCDQNHRDFVMFADDYIKALEAEVEQARREGKIEAARHIYHNCTKCEVTEERIDDYIRSISAGEKGE